MSETENKSLDADPFKVNEALYLLKENCKSYIEMSTQEKSDSLKINYLSSLIKLSHNLKIDDESFILNLFDEILFKDLNILKSRNVFSYFISILDIKQKKDLFQQKFFSLLNLFGNEYNANSIYFHQYLIDISLYYIFTSNYVCEEKTKYIEMIIDNDIKPFETQLFKRIINKNEKLVDDNKNKINMVKCLFNKFIDMNKYKSCLILFMRILENVNYVYQNIPKEIIFELIKMTNNKGFNHVIKKTKEINDFLIFNCLLLGNLDERLFVSKVDIDMFDIYLVNLLNLLALKKDLNYDIFNKIFDFYSKNKYINLNKIFLDVIYYLSTYSYSNSQNELIFNCINNPNTNIIYNKIIKNHLLSLNKRPINENLLNNSKNIKFSVVTNLLEKKDFNLFEDSLFSFENNNSSNNISFLNHFNLFHYIINSSFSINNNKSDDIILIQFYPKILNKILLLLNNLSLENSNKKLFEELILFLLDLFSVLIKLYLSQNDFFFNEDYLITSLLKIIQMSSSENKYVIIFPSFINIIKTTFDDDCINDNILNNNKLYNFIFDYMISNFSDNDNSNTSNNQQFILIFKSLIILFANKKISKLQKKIFVLDKLIDLSLKSGNEKIINSFYKLCEELMRTNDEENIKLSYYSMNKFSKLMNNDINDTFIDYITDKFKIFIKKPPNCIEFNEEVYFTINTISNIYNRCCIKYNGAINDKFKNLNGFVEDFCKDKIIKEIIDYLFMSIETSKCDIINIIKDEKNIYLKYDKLNKLMDNLDYYVYILENYFDKNIQNNKKSLCHYGILKSLAHLLSGYLSNSIYSLLYNEENKIENKESALEEKIIINSFDYIKNKILYNLSLQNTSYPIYFINCTFSNKYILHYFMVHYTEFSIKEINKSFIQDMSEKNNAILNYIQQNPYNILFMKDIIKCFIEFDSNIVNGKKNDLINNRKTSRKLYGLNNIINKLMSNENVLLSEYNDEQKAMINSFFTKIFLDELFENANQIKTLENSQIIILFLLDNSLLDKYFDLFGYFINNNYVLIQLYSIIRTFDSNSKLNEKFINFINKYIYLDDFGNYILRILSNSKTFKNLYKSKYISIDYINNLYNISGIILNNIATNLNEHKNININDILINILLKIIEHINEFYKINPNYANLELHLFGKIVRSIISKLNEKLEIHDNNTEDNPKINSTIELIYSSILPKYIKRIYDIIMEIFDDKNKNNFEYELDNVFNSFSIVIDIISKTKSDKKNFDILSSKIENNIFHFFLIFLVFNQHNQYLINLSYFTSFREKYSECKNNSIYKKFLEYLYLFSLLKGKQDEKNLKSVIIEFFGECKEDNQTKEDLRKYGYLACYILSTIKKDQFIGNKNNNKTIFNIGDFSIIKSIGERFKDDEKSIQKNNLVITK